MHTPGPWTLSDVVNPTPRMVTIPIAGGEVIWTVYGPTKDHRHDAVADLIGTEANARLIAAAPQLLAALHSAASCLIAIQAGVGPAPDAAATLRTVRAALAAARGEG